MDPKLSQKWSSLERKSTVSTIDFNVNWKLKLSTGIRSALNTSLMIYGTLAIYETTKYTSNEEVDIYSNTSIYEYSTYRVSVY